MINLKETWISNITKRKGTDYLLDMELEKVNTNKVTELCLIKTESGNK